MHNVCLENMLCLRTTLAMIAGRMLMKQTNHLYLLGRPKRRSIANLPTSQPILDKAIYAFLAMSEPYLGYKIRTISELLFHYLFAPEVHHFLQFENARSPRLFINISSYKIIPLKELLKVT